MYIFIFKGLNPVFETMVKSRYMCHGYTLDYTPEAHELLFIVRIK